MQVKVGTSKLILEVIPRVNRAVGSCRKNSYHSHSDIIETV
jgi:hypothetical protein